MQTKIFTFGTLIALALVAPLPVQAYLNPYDVLLSQDLLLPSSSRDSLSRIERQQRESEARRDREQEAIFAEQNPPILAEEEFFADESDEVFRAAAPEYAYEENAYVDREFLSLMRTLERVKSQQHEAQLKQQALALLQAEGFHAGAPLLDAPSNRGVLPTGSKGLSDTGAGTMLAIGVVLVAVYWTVRRARKDEQMTRELLG